LSPSPATRGCSVPWSTRFDGVSWLLKFCDDVSDTESLAPIICVTGWVAYQLRPMTKEQAVANSVMNTRRRKMTRRRFAKRCLFIAFKIIRTSTLWDCRYEILDWRY